MHQEVGTLAVRVVGDDDSVSLAAVHLFQNLQRLGSRHQYAPIDVINIQGNIITTEKDAVKLARFDMDNIYALKLKTVINVEELLK